MNKGSNPAIVNLLDRTHSLVSYRRKVGGARVVLSLRRTFGARDRAGHRVKHQNPAQRELSHGHSFRHEGTYVINGLQTGFVINAGKSLAAIERLTMAIEGAMIVRRELRL